MTKFEPIAAKGMSDRALMEAIAVQNHELHGCLESHIAETKLANLTATEHRIEVAKKIGEIELKQDVQGGQLTKLAQMWGAEAVSPGEKRPKPKVALTWKNILAFAGAAGGFVVIFQVFAPAVAAFFVALFRALMAANA